MSDSDSIGSSLKQLSIQRLPIIDVENLEIDTISTKTLSCHPSRHNLSVSGLSKGRVHDEQKENKIAKLKQIIEQKDKELEIVDWYIRVFEGGHDTKQILDNFIEARAKIIELEERLENETGQQKKTIERLRERLQETQDQLKKMQEKVVKPLIS